MKIIDMTGQKFGRLIVLGIGGRNRRGRITWKCKCDCGKIKNIVQASLRRGLTQSCGCLRNERILAAGKFCDLKARVFGRLTVQKFFGRNKRSRRRWKCVCLCGKTTIVNQENLTQGSTQSCGCLRKELQASIRGRQHHSWNHNLSTHERILSRKRNKLPEYYVWRNSIMDRDDYTCRICGEIGGRLAAHHLESWQLNKSKRYDADNGVTLCSSCHKLFHSGKWFGPRKTTKEQFDIFEQFMGVAA